MLMRRVHDVFVNFIGNNEGVVLLCEVRNRLQFFSAEDPSGRIRWVAEHQRFHALFEGGSEFIGIEAEFRGPQGHEYRLGSGEDRIWPVVFIEG